MSVVPINNGKNYVAFRYLDCVPLRACALPSYFIVKTGLLTAVAVVHRSSTPNRCHRHQIHPSLSSSSMRIHHTTMSPNTPINLTPLMPHSLLPRTPIRRTALIPLSLPIPQTTIIRTPNITRHLNDSNRNTTLLILWPKRHPHTIRRTRRA